MLLSKRPFPPRGKRNIGPFGEAALDNTKTDTAASAGNENDLAAQIQIQDRLLQLGFASLELAWRPVLTSTCAADNENSDRLIDQSPHWRDMPRDR